jgi:hypothetical protein
VVGALGAAPRRAQRVVAGLPDLIGDQRQPSQRNRDLSRDEEHRDQQQREQERGRPEMPPHPREQALDPSDQQMVQLRARLRPRLPELSEERPICRIDVRARHCRCLVDRLSRGDPERFDA